MAAKLLRNVLIFLFLLLMPLSVMAQTATPSTDASGQADASVGLTQRLLCQTVWLFQSEIGLIVGLAMAALGLWLIVRGSGLKTGMILIICGALLSALPTLAMSFFSGLNSFLVQSNLSTTDYNDQMMAPLRSLSNCESIFVDVSGYASASSEGGAASGGSTAGAAASMSGVNPNAAQATQQGGSSAGGKVDPNATKGGLGCGQLVDGGHPSSPFDPNRMHPILHIRRPHTGVDIGCGRVGPNIRAAGGGSVSFVGWQNGYGKRIEVKNNNGHINTYSHLNDYVASVGQTVNGNDVIAHCGNFGLSTGAHLHYEVKVNGTYVDPVSQGCQ